MTNNAQLNQEAFICEWPLPKVLLLKQTVHNYILFFHYTLIEQGCHFVCACNTNRLLANAVTKLGVVDT